MEPPEECRPLPRGPLAISRLFRLSLLGKDNGDVLHPNPLLLLLYESADMVVFDPSIRLSGGGLKSSFLENPLPWLYNNNNNNKCVIL